MGSKIQVFQFWDLPDIPPRVKTMIHGWRDDDDFDHELFDTESAARLIAAKEGAEAEKLFRSCLIPAMQSDLFRLVVLKNYPGLYLDADLRNMGGLPSVLLDAQVGVIRRANFLGEIYFANDLLFVKEPDTLLIRTAWDLALENVRKRKHPLMYMYAGPVIFEDFLHGDDGSRLFKGWTFLDEPTFAKHVTWHYIMGYKKSKKYQKQMSRKPQPPSNFFS